MVPTLVDATRLGGSVISAALIIAAPASGAGKTTVTLAVLAALRRRGMAVRSAKSGPDYIDAGFHQAATGAACVNLDSWAMAPAQLDANLAEACRDAEILVIESAMGLFDGVAGQPGRTGAAADIAARYGIPVLLVLNVSGQSQSAGAVARGFMLHNPDVEIAGVVMNRVGSDRHRDNVTQAVEALPLPVFGCIPRDPAIGLPERHLGLVQASERQDLAALFSRLAELGERLDLGAILNIARPPRLAVNAAPDVTTLRRFAMDASTDATRAARPDLDASADVVGTAQLDLVTTANVARSARLDRDAAPESTQSARLDPDATADVSRSVPDLNATPEITRPTQRPLSVPAIVPPPGRRIALARDAAFSFTYAHVLAGWRAAGAELVAFSPLADEAPPAECDACWLPGGYPELHAARLAGAERFRAGMRHFAATRPVYGECGGYMVLGTTLQDSAGLSHPMLGLLGHTTSFARPRLHLGYREARLLADSPLGRAGSVLRGHEFHYATTIDPGQDEPFAHLSDAGGRDLGPAGSRRGHVSGSFFHAIAPAVDRAGP